MFQIDSAARKPAAPPSAPVNVDAARTGSAAGRGRPATYEAGTQRFGAGQNALRAYGADARASVISQIGLAGARGPDETTFAGPGTAPGQTSFSIQGGTLYELGKGTRPKIHHDNGFLQNPNDPSDPTPMATRKPTSDERRYYAAEVIKAEAAGKLSKLPFLDKLDSRLGLDNALEAYKHFLTGNGADFKFDLNAYLHDDKNGQHTLAKVMGDVRGAADDLLRDLDRSVGPNPGDSVSFQIHSDVMATEKDGFRYPASEDWQKAIGGHSFWSSADITVTRNADGTLDAKATVTIEAEDRYNFNPGQKDIATNVPDSERGVLEQTGLAHQFTQTGKASYVTEWTVGASQSPNVEAEEVSGR